MQLIIRTQDGLEITIEADEMYVEPRGLLLVFTKGEEEQKQAVIPLANLSYVVSDAV